MITKRPSVFAKDSAATIRRRQRLWRDKLEQPYLAFFEKGWGRDLYRDQREKLIDFSKFRILYRKSTSKFFAAPGAIFHNQKRAAAIPDGNAVLFGSRYKNDTVFLFDHIGHIFAAMLHIFILSINGC